MGLAQPAELEINAAARRGPVHVAQRIRFILYTVFLPPLLAMHRRPIARVAAGGQCSEVEPRT
jgi:hypothetical protein